MLKYRVAPARVAPRIRQPRYDNSSQTSLRVHRRRTRRSSRRHRATFSDRGMPHAEARAAYEQVARNYPGSLRARDALLQDARLFMQDGQAAAIPVALKQLSAKDDAAALLLTAKAYEQTGNSTSALASYRRIYFFTPASAEASEAASSITRMNSTTAAASAEEATARAERLFAAKRYGEAYDAY